MEKSLLLKEKDEKRDQGCSGITWSEFAQEAKRVGYLAGPMVAVNLSQYFLQIISIMMVGHLGELSLSSTAIAISLAAVSGFSPVVSPFLLILDYFPQSSFSLIFLLYSAQSSPSKIGIRVDIYLY